MKLTNEIVVPASVDEAWAVMLDVARLAPCLPGASIDAVEGERFRGTMKVKLGPITSSFRGTLQIDEADEEARRAVLSARASDSRGQGTASATITSTMAPVDEGTLVTVETDLSVTGPAASFGRGVMQDVSARLMREFAEGLAAEMGRTAGATQAGAAAGSGASDRQGGPAGSPGVALAGPLPPDVPEPPPTDAVVHWPAGTEPPGTKPPGRAPEPARASDDVLDLGAFGRGALARRLLTRRLLPAAGVVAGLLLLAAVLRARARR